MQKFLAIILALGISMPAFAADHPIVVELYTSQGCSSCPPADALLEDLAKRDDLIALALHVDYWDYLGWRDIFGSPTFSERQRQYAHATGAKTIYTPQMIIGGEMQVVGSRPMQVSKAISALKAKDPPDLIARRQGSRIVVSAPAMQGLPAKMVVQLVTYVPMEETRIRRGENANRTIRYANIVHDWQEIGKWDGRRDLSLSLTAPSDLPAAVIIQQAGYGPIVAAARVR